MFIVWSLIAGKTHSIQGKACTRLWKGFQAWNPKPSNRSWSILIWRKGQTETGAKGTEDSINPGSWKEGKVWCNPRGFKQHLVEVTYYSHHEFLVSVSGVSAALQPGSFLILKAHSAFQAQLLPNFTPPPKPAPAKKPLTEAQPFQLSCDSIGAAKAEKWMTKVPNVHHGWRSFPVRWVIQCSTVYWVSIYQRQVAAISSLNHLWSSFSQWGKHKYFFSFFMWPWSDRQQKSALFCPQSFFFLYLFSYFVTTLTEY